MADSSQLEKDVEGFKHVLRILAEHIGMSADARRQIGVHLGDLPAAPPAPPPDPRDVALAEMRRELDAMKAARDVPTETPTPSAPVWVINTASTGAPLIDIVPESISPDVLNAD